MGHMTSEISGSLTLGKASGRVSARTHHLWWVEIAILITTIAVPLAPPLWPRPLQGGPTPRSCHKMCLDPEGHSLYLLGRYLDPATRADIAEANGSALIPVSAAWLAGSLVPRPLLGTRLGWPGVHGGDLAPFRPLRATSTGTAWTQTPGTCSPAIRTATEGHSWSTTIR